MQKCFEVMGEVNDRLVHRAKTEGLIITPGLTFREIEISTQSHKDHLHVTINIDAKCVWEKEGVDASGCKFDEFTALVG